MIIVGFDTATATGWAVYDSDLEKVIDYGTKNFKDYFPEKGAIARSALFVVFHKWLKKHFHDLDHICGIDFVCYEVPHFRGGQTIKLVGLAVLIEMHCEVRGICFDGVHSGALKKFITGHGKASKNKMRKFISDKTGIDKRKLTHDEADAIAVCLWAASEYAPKKRKIIKRK